jgi:hypothetical protein
MALSGCQACRRARQRSLSLSQLLDCRGPTLLYLRSHTAQPQRLCTSRIEVGGDLRQRVHRFSVGHVTLLDGPKESS